MRGYAKSRFHKKKFMSICREAAYAEIFRKNDDFWTFWVILPQFIAKIFEIYFFVILWYMPNEQNVHFKLWGVCQN